MKRKGETAAPAGIARGGLLAAALALVPFRAQAMLRTVVLPPEVPAAAAPAPALEVAETGVFAFSGSCAEAEQDIDALEGAVVEVKARYWAYLMKQPDFFERRPARHPGAEIGNSAIKAYFDSRLLFWYQQKDVPAPSLSTIEKINDVTQKISAMAAACGTGKS